MSQTNGDGKRYWRPLDPTRHHRENKWDYRGRAIYHFTLVVEGRFPLFGRLEGDSADTAYVKLSTFGHRVYRMISGLAQFYERKGFAIKVLTQKVMPDHIHLLIQVLEPLPKSIGAVVRGFKSECTKVFKQEYTTCGENAAELHEIGIRQVEATEHPNTGIRQTTNQQATNQQATNQQATNQQATNQQATNQQTTNQQTTNQQATNQQATNQQATNQQATNQQEETDLVHFARIFAGRGSIWEQNPAYYHERILHAPGQLRRMIDYILDNPRRLWLKSHHPNLFKLHRQTDIDGLTFTSMGNHFLLDWPDRQMVEMSRSASDEQIAQRLQSALAATRNGAVTYTAAISKGEQLIARTLREQGYPWVVLLNDGFPPEGSPHERFYKPGGVYFDACSKGQLLMLEPSKQTFSNISILTAVEETLRQKAKDRNYIYTPVPATSQRYNFITLNVIAKKLTER